MAFLCFLISLVGIFGLLVVLRGILFGFDFLVLCWVWEFCLFVSLAFCRFRCLFRFLWVFTVGGFFVLFWFLWCGDIFWGVFLFLFFKIIIYFD